MKKIITAALMAFVSYNTHATAINFDDGSPGNIVGNFYSSQGVTFSNAAWTNNFGLPGSSGSLGIIVPFTYQWGISNPLVATFSSNVTDVRVDGIDVGGNGLQIDAYDALSGGTLISSNSVFGSTAGVGQFFSLAASGASIKRVEIFQVQNVFGDGILLDNFQFSTIATSVPEPATFALMGLGFAGLNYRRRKSSTQINNQLVTA
jgi:hypothetical protein